MALLLRESDVESVIDMEGVIGALELAMRELGDGNAQNQPRRRVFPPGGVLNVMFATWPGGGLSGFKAYTVSGGKVRFLVTVFDLQGAPVALIEADRMGTYRTGAATGLAALRLTSPGPKTVGVIGTGWQARTQVLAIQAALRPVAIRVFGRDRERRRRFASEVGAIAAESAEDCVRDADLVVTITTSGDPVLEAAWVKPDALVVGAGSNFPNRAELPPDLIASARAVVVDQLDTARLESGDLLRAAYDFERALELGAILAGKAELPSGDGPVVFESQGLALWDVAAAKVVVDRARERGLGEEIRLFENGA